ncbi:MAG TPA: LysM domain-containing protein [Gammaproteobacteria bacterium]
MSYIKSPFARRACLVLAAALGVVAASNGIAQQRSATPAAQPDSGPVLNPRHPERYVVQRGDTLWDIAALFLRDPWYWPEIWQINPQVENPHLIYPGDILSLAYVDGRPVLQLERVSNTERLSPRVRSEPIEEAIPTIPYEAIRAFLTRPLVLDPDQLETLPYVVAHHNGLMGSAGRDVYVRGAEAAAVDDVFNVVHVGDPLVDPDDGDVIGYEAIYVGQGRLRRAGDPGTLFLTDSARETLVGDLLVDEETPAPVDFLPRAPEQPVEGRIISVVDGVSLIGQYQVVVINRGAQHGLEPGHVLRAWQTGDVVRDRVRRGNFGQKVQLPDEPAGVMMVFRTFDRVSYALIMEATNEIRVLDAVRNP